MRIVCYQCETLTDISPVPVDDEHIALCAECDKQLAWPFENPATRELTWHLIDGAKEFNR